MRVRAAALPRSGVWEVLVRTVPDLVAPGRRTRIIVVAEADTGRTRAWTVDPKVRVRDLLGAACSPAEVDVRPGRPVLIRTMSGSASRLAAAARRVRATVETVDTLPAAERALEELIEDKLGPAAYLPKGAVWPELLEALADAAPWDWSSVIQHLRIRGDHDLLCAGVQVHVSNARAGGIGLLVFPSIEDQEAIVEFSHLGVFSKEGRAVRLQLLPDRGYQDGIVRAARDRDLLVRGHVPLVNRIRDGDVEVVPRGEDGLLRVAVEVLCALSGDRGASANVPTHLGPVSVEWVAR